MAKESMKAREVKRAKLIAKYADKRAKFIAEGNYDLYRHFREIHRPSAITIVAKSPVVLKDICVNLVYRVFNFAKWHQMA